MVWSAGPGASNPLPTLALEKFVDTPLNEMQSWAGSAVAAVWPEALQGACSAPLGQLTRNNRAAFCSKPPSIRFQRKAHELEIRARQAGWEQALWEGLFRALGYKQNIWPMQRVAELLPRLGDAGRFPARLAGAIIRRERFSGSVARKEPPP